jgi:prephenate dehydratase
MTNKVLFLGPEGSYSDIVKNKFECLFENTLVYEALDSIYQIAKTVENSEDNDIFAILPIENSVEGIVRETQDCLTMLSQKGFKIIAETTIPIEHCLIGFGDKDKAKTVVSHPQAIAQCREYIYKTWGNDISIHPAFSTSNAVKSLTKENDTFIAIGNKFCAEIYDVPIIESNINDRKNNATRFILLGNFKLEKADKNKVSITFSTENKAGALNKVLNILDKYEINMSYIDSRPSRKELGEYVFYVDFAGYIEDSNIALALIEIQNQTKMLEILSDGAICV